MNEPLFGKTLSQLEEIAGSMGLPPFTARQIANWLYRKNVRSIDAMTNLSRAVRDRLDSEYLLGLEDPARVSVSTDGTRKYLYRTGPVESAGGSRYVEAAYIPETGRSTLCLSTQIGCKMGCLFCMTGKQGFQGQLGATEILNQFESLPEKNTVTNLVYMGMGEPMDNLDPVMQSLEVLCSDWGYGLSPARITVSTIGIIPGIQRFLAESGAHLAVSMHSPFEEERRRLMPVQHVYPLREVLELLRKSDLPRQRRVSFEYIVFGGLNHSAAHVKEIARLLTGIRSRVNLIRFHTIPDTPLVPATDEQMIIFQNQLKAKGILTTIRKSRGQDILAACGLLSTRELTKSAAAVDY